MRITPTQWAEEGYQAAKAARQRPVRIGPAGLPIPEARAIYRSTLDPELSRKLGRAAFAAYLAQELPPEAWRQVSATLRAFMLSERPAADLEVLERYGAAVVVATLSVKVPLFGRHSSVRVSVEPMRVVSHNGYGDDGPFHGWNLHHRVRPDSSHSLAVPAEAQPFFDLYLEVRAKEEPAFNSVPTWASKFRTEHGRWPRWYEIERAFPLLGAWMQGQRQ